ncbi:MAG: MBL fold metallo-hydrolase [Bacteroidota bacterium]
MQFILPLFSLALLVVIAGVIFVATAPQFGAPPDEAAQQKFIDSPQFKNGEFVNRGGVTVEIKGSTMFQTLKEFITAKNTRPSTPLPVGTAPSGVDADPPDSLARVTWFGHSAVFLEMDGKRILIDPMLGPAASPLPVFGKRFGLKEPIDMSRFTNIDAVLISHDHYDHLDYRSILKLKKHVSHFYVPLGVGSHLRRWGVSSERITELDWWDSVEFDGIRLTATPAQHFSGRGPKDRNRTLWASWTIRGKHQNIFFSGDSGYGPHFKEIGERLGPFDFTMLECGQYNEKWASIHSMPEESVQANIDLRGKIMMPIHWGAFQLAVHTWTDPVERASAAAEKRGVRMATPMIGESFIVGNDAPASPWWRTVDSTATAHTKHSIPLPDVPGKPSTAQQ